MTETWSLEPRKLAEQILSRSRKQIAVRVGGSEKITLADGPDGTVDLVAETGRMRVAHSWPSAPTMLAALVEGMAPQHPWRRGDT